MTINPLTVLEFSHASHYSTQVSKLPTPNKPQPVQVVNSALIAKETAQRYYDWLLSISTTKLKELLQEKHIQQEINQRATYHNPDPNCKLLFFGIDYKRAYCPDEAEREVLAKATSSIPHTASKKRTRRRVRSRKQPTNPAPIKS